VSQEQPEREAVVATLAGLAAGVALDDEGFATLAASQLDGIADGIGLQLEILETRRAAGEELGGWKVGWTSRGARNKDGAGGIRPVGYVLKSRVLGSGATIDASAINNCKLEPEIAVVIGERLSGAVTPEEARAAVRAVAPAFEVNSSRLRPGLSTSIRVGNGLNNWGIVIGEEQDPNQPLDAFKVDLLADGELIETGSSGVDVLDDPFLSLSRGAALLAEYGLAFEPGQTIITGSLTAPVLAVHGTHYEARFGDFGSVSVTC
jgi:2-keto-4-pentenoate hydratase